MSKNSNSEILKFLDEPEFAEALEKLQNSFPEICADQSQDNATSRKALLKKSLLELAVEDPQAAKIFELHRISGLSFDEVSEVVGVSVSDVSNKWKYAKAWLKHRLNEFSS